MISNICEKFMDKLNLKKQLKNIKIITWSFFLKNICDVAQLMVAYLIAKSKAIKNYDSNLHSPTSSKTCRAKKYFADVFQPRTRLDDKKSSSV